MICIPSFIKASSGILKLMGGGGAVSKTDTHTKTAWRMHILGLKKKAKIEQMQIPPDIES
jgi:hypothetical protein